jgi:hypothetical protein
MSRRWLRGWFRRTGSPTMPSAHRPIARWSSGCDRAGLSWRWSGPMGEPLTAKALDVIGPPRARLRAMREARGEGVRSSSTAVVVVDGIGYPCRSTHRDEEYGRFSEIQMARPDTGQGPAAGRSSGKTCSGTACGSGRCRRQHLCFRRQMPSRRTVIARCGGL